MTHLTFSNFSLSRLVSHSRFTSSVLLLLLPASCSQDSPPDLSSSRVSVTGLTKMYVCVAETSCLSLISLFSAEGNDGAPTKGKGGDWI